MSEVEENLVGANLRDLRYRRGLSQADLAELSGVGQDSISTIESGKHRPRPSTVRKLASALDVEVEELVVGPKGPPPSIVGLLEAARVETRWAALEEEEWAEVIGEADAEEARRLYFEITDEQAATQSARWEVGKTGTREEQRVAARMLARYFRRGLEAAVAAKDRRAEERVEAAFEEELAGAR